ncbi:MAG: pyridoxamine 5'-phosphate oxidase family protein [Candidatus Omnitrophica bacterium]|nr:pyridoxamine 5'-phosphate oxidase family protein [Candidatus Omnitrophota bacterium]MBU1869308.1 pyridoxamine 5'-phosphate oxidase family protein [Candidatus Omnitrophota bacterium]
MIRIPEAVVGFFDRQGFVIVSSIGKDGSINCSCKGIVSMDPVGKVFLLDLYLTRTFRNLKENPAISITNVDEHKFSGYCLKGKAKILPRDKIEPQLLKAWEDKITSRLTKRLLKNIHDEKGHARHPEVSLPKPEYMIEMDVEEIIDLTPRHLK